MAVREIDETEFLTNQKLKETVAAILKHPTARRQMLLAQKEAFPDTVIPELDATKPGLDAAAEVRKELDAFKKEQAELRAKEKEENETASRAARWESGRRALIDKHNVTEDGLKAVEDLMVKKGIADHEDAWIIFEKMNPPPTPAISSSGSGPWGFMDQPDDTLDKNFKALIDSRGEDERALNSLINSALNEARGATPSR